MPAINITISIRNIFKLTEKAQKERNGNMSGTINDILDEYFQKEKERSEKR